MIDRILESGVGVLDAEYDMVWFPGDELFAATRARGLPIGNLTSQFWANCYLTGFDHYVKRTLRCPAYLRYVDDMLFFGDSLRELHRWRECVIERLASLRLTLHEESAYPRPTSEGIPFLGFTVFPHKRRLKRRKGIAYERKLRHMVALRKKGLMGEEPIYASVRGWLNHVRYGNTEGLQRAILRRAKWSLEDREEMKKRRGKVVSAGAKEPRIGGQNVSAIFTRTIDFVTWLSEMTNHFPRNHRLIVTKRTLDSALDFQETLIAANHRRDFDRLKALNEADEQLDRIRFYLRLALRWKWLSDGQYGHAATMIEEIGRLLGGWKKNCAENRKG